MNEADIVKLVLLTSVTMVKLAGPTLIASLVVGVAVSIFQAVFQVNDQTLSMVPKLVTIGAVLLVMTPWNLSVSTEFVQQLMTMIPTLLR